MNSLYKALTRLIICMVLISTAVPTVLAQGAVDPAVTSDEITMPPELAARSKREKVFWTTMIGVPVATILYGNEFWEWGSTQRWRWANEGFFGKETDSGGTDKVGHLFTHYVMARALYNIFDYTETNKKNTYYYSIGMTAAFGLLIEIGDAYTGNYGFSFEDLLVDYIGLALGIFMENHPTIESFIGLSWEYVPTKAFLKEETGYPDRFNFTSDYSGHRYMINFKFAGFHYMGYKIPEFLRYLMLDVGYRTDGFTKYDGDDEEKRRNIYIGISVNFQEIVRDLYKGKPRTVFGKSLEQTVKYYHIPVRKNFEQSF